jgi:Uma2 family endonuclease
MSAVLEKTRPAADIPMRPWTREEFDRAREVGLFGPEERLELISGWIVPQEPMNRRHALALLAGFPVLQAVFTGGVYVQQQLPLALSTDGEPLPDFAVVRGTPAQYIDHPTEADTLLVVEVSDSTLSFDRTHKVALYANAQIPEYWIVNLVDRTLAVYRQPQGNTYLNIQILPATATVISLSSPTPIPVASLLP